MFVLWVLVTLPLDATTPLFLSWEPTTSVTLILAILSLET
jgi:hypothetical protein